MKLIFFQIWINNMRGLTAAGARSNSQKRELSEKIHKKYPDSKSLGNGWHVFTNVSEQDIQMMKHLAKTSHRSYTFKEYDSNSEELYEFLKDYNYLHEFKCNYPNLVKNIDYPIDTPDGFENRTIRYMLTETGVGAMRVINMSPNL